MPRYRLYKGKPRHLVGDPHSPLGAQQYVAMKRCKYRDGDKLPAEAVDRYEPFEQVRRAGPELEKAVKQGHLLSLSDLVVADNVADATAQLAKRPAKAHKPAKGDNQ